MGGKKPYAWNLPHPITPLTPSSHILFKTSPSKTLDTNTFSIEECIFITDG